MLQRCVFVTQKEIETEYEKQFRTYMQGMQAWTGTHFQFPTGVNQLLCASKPNEKRRALSS
jgi:hypothetical protein